MGHGLIELYHFLSGAAFVASWVAGVFFFRFWSKTRDRLFLFFGVSFWVMAVERLVLALLSDPNSEDRWYVYLLRLFAFAIIIYGVVDKNRQERVSAPGPR